MDRPASHPQSVSCSTRRSRGQRFALPGSGPITDSIPRSISARLCCQLALDLTGTTAPVRLWKTRRFVLGSREGAGGKSEAAGLQKGTRRISSSQVTTEAPSVGERQDFPDAAIIALPLVVQRAPSPPSFGVHPPRCPRLLCAR